MPEAKTVLARLRRERPHDVLVFTALCGERWLYRPTRRTLLTALREEKCWGITCIYVLPLTPTPLGIAQALEGIAELVQVEWVDLCAERTGTRC